MPRYFFRLTDGKEVLNPHEGLELPGSATAREEAVRLARSIAQGHILPGRKWDNWFIRVLDSHGNEIDTIPIDVAPDDLELP
jgi:Domain of unknown function (DUF6894)